jgi:glycosyltransferase involved in cell wall biosynthesis
MSRSENRPAISIGLPVYNGARFIAEAFDSLLGQTFGDFELIVSDNCSTDDTPRICETYAKRDPRISYTRQSRNLGATFNWNFVVRAARGRLFKWASANDRCAPTMLEDCARVLNENPGVALCYGTTILIDDDGRALGTYEGDPEIMDDSPSRRFQRVLTELSLNNAQSGLINMDVLRSTRLERHYPAGDHILMAEIALRGRYRKLPDVLLYRRMGKESTTKFLSPRELREFHDPDASTHQRVSWQNHTDCIRSALRAPVGTREKLRATHVALRRAYWERGKLWRDLWHFGSRSEVTARGEGRG